ncbi:minor capsid protein, partial [Clostridioides difficile]|uniref:minor capsid protein n=1 Tax=Clostridioides difficile TaxID=1496 RepID=UPI00190F072B
MKHKDYWRKRFEQLEEAQNNKSVKYYLELEKQYKLAMNSIEKDILAWYNRFAKNEGISLLEAKKLLNTRELEEFKWSVEEYIRHGKENAINQKWMKELENASARVHITRLEALKLQIQQQVEVLYGNELDGIDKLMRDIYTSGYYHTAFNVQQGVNVGWSLMSLDTNRINKIISKPWATDGLNFSERIWGKYRPTLVNELHTKLTQSIIRGENPKVLVNEFSKKFNVSKSQAKNLIMTESAFFASASRKDCFNDLDVEKYEIIATLDLKTSNICRELDGKVFDMKDYQVGVTAPPFHCRCRTTTAPFFSDEEGYRAARGEDGKTYYVPSSMKYNEWYEKHIEGRLGKEKANTLRKMQLNESKDRKQFEEYKKVLGNEIPSKFDEYQHMKYNDTIRYEEAKKLY